MDTALSRKLFLIPWLMAFAALQTGCGTSRRIQEPLRGIDPASLIQTARSQLGVTYQAGGSTPTTGFDCSGFVQWVFRQHGLALPRQSYDQYQVGESISPRKLYAGDLVFFEIEKQGASHVGIYMDRGLFVHSSSTGGRVREDFLGDPYWRDHFLGARRVLFTPYRETSGPSSTSLSMTPPPDHGEQTGGCRCGMDRR